MSFISFSSLTNSFRKDELVFPPLNSYQRLLLHKMADYYHLFHAPLEPSNKTVLCIRKIQDGSARILPPFSLKDFYEVETDAAASSIESLADIKLMRRSATHNSPPAEPLVVSTLRRAASQTFEEKETAYKLARDRIFNSSPVSLTDLLPEENVPVILKELSGQTSALETTIPRITIQSDSELFLVDENEKSKTLDFRLRKPRLPKYALQDSPPESHSQPFHPCPIYEIASNFTSMSLNSRSEEPDILTFPHILAFRFKKPISIEELSDLLLKARDFPEFIKAVPFDDKTVYIVVYGHQRKAGQVLLYFENHSAVAEASVLQIAITRDEYRSKTF
jgi:SUZ domain/R3H domain